MPHEDRFNRSEIPETESHKSLPRAVRAEPVRPRRKGIGISLYWSFGVKITRPKRRSQPAAADCKPDAPKLVLES